ncbi:sugar porter family MFS transporter [Oenococcus oeni]|uniref:sugar porter family MFS transporter n=1 Tax=Oenococcus oeni TaxID=1247 RepID=UPI0007A76128|nr:sugar porter family MFS transporter [Oenococcus oeni]KZD14809.1 Major myo-inositol transporter IolT [Oenococcus oeni]
MKQAIETIPANKKLKYINKIAILATFGAFLFGYDTGVINGSLPFMARGDELNLSPFMEGLVTSSLLFGAAIGAVIWGRLADRYGRKSILRVLAIIFFFSTLGSSIAPNSYVLIIGRLFMGLAVGGVAGIVPVYLGEMAPSNIRGSLVCQDQMMIVLGQLLAYVMNGILGNAFNVSYIWRFMIALAAIPAIILWIGTYIIPETPRWLAIEKKSDQALVVLRNTRDDKTADQDLKHIEQNIKKESSRGHASLHDFHTPWIKRILIIGITIAVMQQLAGINIMMYYGTTILEKTGFSTKAALIANIGNGVLSVLGTTIYMFFLANRIKRRLAWIGGFCFTTTILAAIAILSHYAAGLSILPYIVITCTMLFVFVDQMTLGPVCWLLLSEIFPFHVRGLGVGIATFGMWIMDFGVGFFFPILIEIFGLSNTFWIFAVIGVICIIISFFIIPETSGRSLEQLEDSFRRS